MGMKLYNLLVNKHAGIRHRYHKMHDGAHGAGKIASWLYLLWMNFCYYVLFCRFLDQLPAVETYEEKVLLTKQSESAYGAGLHPDVKEFTEKLLGYDVISFDIFDTLIFRPFTEPTDVFYFIGERLGQLDFKRIRMEQEFLSRQDCHKKNGHYEVTLEEIWNRIERETGISAKEGMELEKELELSFCYANPFMKQVFDGLIRREKHIIITSDMYLPSEMLRTLLDQNGFSGYKKLYVSCEYGINKAKGDLFSLVKKELPQEASVIHVGDNENSDVKMPKKAGFDSLWYPNVNKMALSYRPYDMSPVIGGAYRGIVDNHLYQGTQVYSMEYEYGFIYGGLFVLGYCQFVHEYCREHQMDKILFLARDGDILKQVYDRLFPEENTAYVYWSRAAATKLMAPYNRYDYIRRYISHKVNQEIPIKKILQSMEQEFLIPELAAYTDRDESGKGTGISLTEEALLTDRNAPAVKRFILAHYDEVIASYQKQDAAAKEYCAKELAGCRRAAAVDIGWAGSGAISLAWLVERAWKLPCEIIGIIAGTNTVHNAEPDASEAFLQSGKLVSYLFSMAHNRDLMKKHDLNKDYNVFWELLLSSPTRQFLGFGEELRFGKLDANQDGIREVQRGILDFVEEYRRHFENYPWMFRISGRDAYAPMLLAAGKNEKYLKMMEQKFALEIGVS